MLKQIIKEKTTKEKETYVKVREGDLKRMITDYAEIYLMMEKIQEWFGSEDNQGLNLEVDKVAPLLIGIGDSKGLCSYWSETIRKEYLGK